MGFDNRYELVQTADSEYILRLIIDQEFLTSEDTVYPVLVDPTVAYASSGGIEDTYVCEANGIKYNNDSLLRLGADSNPGIWPNVHICKKYFYVVFQIYSAGEYNFGQV